VLRSFSITAVILLCMALFEAAILSNILFLPIMPDLLLICVLYLSIQNGRLYGVSCGFVSGIFLDFLSASPFGLNCLLRTVIGYTCGFFNKMLNIEGMLMPFIIGVFATLYKAVLIFLISFFFPSVINSYHFFSAQFAEELLLNGILTPIVFKFLAIFRDVLVLAPEKVS
jgi:rod shape-determining protein MreD